MERKNRVEGAEKEEHWGNDGQSEERDKGKSRRLRVRRKKVKERGRRYNVCMCVCERERERASKWQHNCNRIFFIGFTNRMT